MKKYIIQVSFTGSSYIIVPANSAEEAKEKGLESVSLDINSDSEDITVGIEEWDWVINEKSGNVKESYIRNIHVREEEEE